jgi:hypothetical protein
MTPSSPDRTAPGDELAHEGGLRELKGFNDMTTPTPAVEDLDRLESAARAAQTDGAVRGWTYLDLGEVVEADDIEVTICSLTGGDDAIGEFIAAFNPAMALSLISALRAEKAEREHWKGLADEHALFDAETDLAFKDLDHQIADLDARATAAEAKVKAQAEIIETYLNALEEIDAMPGYVEPIPPEYVSGLVKRFNKTLEIARAALSPDTGSADGGVG